MERFGGKEGRAASRSAVIRASRDEANKERTVRSFNRAPDGGLEGGGRRLLIYPAMQSGGRSSGNISSEATAAALKRHIGGRSAGRRTRPAGRDCGARWLQCSVDERFDLCRHSSPVNHRHCPLHSLCLGDRVNRFAAGAWAARVLHAMCVVHAFGRRRRRFTFRIDE